MPRSEPLRNPRSRRERELAERLKRELAQVDPHARSRYVARFLGEFSRAEAGCALAEAFDAAARSDVIYLADYHALPAAQAFAVRLINLLCERAGGRREVVLCLETFYERDQRWLDAFINGGIAEGEFLRRTRYEAEWGYAWDGYRSLLGAAQRRGLRVYGIDCPLRHKPRHIRRRDSAAAERLAGLLGEHGGAQFVVFFGESHLAAEHLPAKTRRAAARLLNGGGHFRDLIIAQNVDELYWQELDGPAGEAGRPAAARVAEGKYCVFTATPLEKYQSYARAIERWQSHEDPEEVGGDEADATNESEITAACARLLDALLDALELNPRRSRLRHARRLADSPPEIYAAQNFGGFAALLRRRGADAAEIKALRGRAQAIGCAYAPRLNALFVSAFDAVSVSEELTRYVAAALRGQLWASAEEAASRKSARKTSAPAVTPHSADALAALMLDEAIVFFASRLLAPHRAAPLPLSSPTARRAARLHPLPSAARREAMARYRGRVRGEAVYQATLCRRLTPPDIHRFLAANFTSPGHAGRLWDELGDGW